MRTFLAIVPLALSGCSASKVSDTGANDSGADDTDQGACGDTDTAEDAGVGSLAARADALANMASGTCGGLIDPWVAGAPDDILKIWTKLLDARVALGDVDSDETCPCLASGSAWDCTTAGGWTLAGSYSQSYGSSGAGGNTFEAHGRLYEDINGRFDLLVDGVAAHAGMGGGGQDKSWIDYREARAHTGIFDEGNNGAWIRSGSLSTLNSWAEAEDFYFMVITDEALPSGDLCANFAMVEVSACPEEPSGTLVIDGAQEWILTYDGDVACDGCGTVTVDGVDFGELCGVVPEVWVE